MCKFKKFFQKLFANPETLHESQEQRMGEEALKKEFPQEWKRYEEFKVNWNAVGIYFLKLPTFEEFLLQKPLEIRREVKNFLDGAGVNC